MRTLSSEIFAQFSFKWVADIASLQPRVGVFTIPIY